MTTETVGWQVCKGIEAPIADPSFLTLTNYHTSHAGQHTNVKA